MSAEALPDELWRKILETGIGNSSFTFKDLCCLSISCRRLHRLSGEDSLWSHLLSSDFHNSSSSSESASIKSIYKIRFEKDRERRLSAHRRAVLRKESQVAENLRKIREIERKLREETDKMKATVAELSNLRRVRQASVALNVWQPKVVRGKQEQMVEQCVIPVESRLHSLEMELRLCKQQIAGFDNAHREQKQRLEKAKEELGSMKYHPLPEYKFTSSEDNECNLMRKKLKTKSVHLSSCGPTKMKGVVCSPTKVGTFCPLCASGIKMQGIFNIIFFLAFVFEPEYSLCCSLKVS